MSKSAVLGEKSTTLDKSDKFSETSSESEELFCPLCVEEIDAADKSFLPCPCGYRVCMWCWHHIRENLNGLCPACRTPYKEDPHTFAAVDRQEIAKKSKEKKLKEKTEKIPTVTKSPAAPGKTGSGTVANSVSVAPIDRKSLHNFRVVQRNLVYVIGLPASLVPNEDTLRKPEFFGQYGKIGKVVVHRNSSHSAAHNTVSAYITFVHKEDAKAAIQALDGHWLDSATLLRASFGTTKYCNNFVRGVACNNPECVYLHEIGDDEDRFTKEEIQAGHSKLNPTPGTNQMVVTGNGGPSGTGKKPSGDPILPPPVFVQDLPTNTPAPKPATNSAPSAAAPPQSATIPQPTISRGSSWTGNTTATAAERKSAQENGSPYNGPSETPANYSPALASKSGTIGDQLAPLPGPASMSQSNSTFNGRPVGFSDSTPQEDKKAVASEKDSATNVAAIVDSQSASTKQPINAPQVSPTEGLTPADMLSPLQRLASGARSESSRHQVAASAFNGLGSSTVFPVPVSSLSISIWSVILTNSGNTLESNPYEKLVVPISELMDLTLPPVDAMGLGTQLWPRPLSYYRRGVDPVLTQQQMLMQKTQQAQQGPFLGGPSLLNNNGAPSLGTAGLTHPTNRIEVLQQQQLQLQQQQAQQQLQQQQRQQVLRQQELFLRSQQLQQGVNPTLGNNGINSGISNGLYGSGGIPNQGLNGQSQNIQNIAALQQMLPSVKLNYGVPGSGPTLHK